MVLLDKKTMCDSDTTLGSDSDITLPPEDEDCVHCSSPNLFNNHPEEMPMKLCNTYNPGNSKFSVDKRHSKVHEISDSDSDSDVRHVKSDSSRTKQYSSTNVIGHKLNVGESRSDLGQHRLDAKLSERKKDTFTTNTNSQSCEKDDNKKFVEEFSNMTDSNSDDKKSCLVNKISTKVYKTRDENIGKDLVLQKGYKKDYSTPISTSDIRLEHENQTVSSKLSEHGDINSAHHKSQSFGDIKSAHQNSRSIADIKSICDIASAQHKSQTSSNKTLENLNSQTRDRQIVHDDSKKNTSFLANNLPVSKKHSASNITTNVRKASVSEECNLSKNILSSRLKRKHPKSPVPPKFQQVVTEILNNTSNESVKNKKPVCKYGSKCYRKNPSHFEEFNHSKGNIPKQMSTPLSSTSSSDESTPAKKKVKVDCEVPSTSNVQDRKISAFIGNVKDANCPRSPSMGKAKDFNSSRSTYMKPQTVVEKFNFAQPYSFFLTKVTGIADSHNSTFVMDIKDILSEEMGSLVASCQFNFMFDIPWLMKQYPAQFRCKPMLIVHGEQGASQTALQAQAMSFTNIRFCQAKLEMMYGTHHTKMMLLLYEEGMRVVIHTANLIEQDWYQKTQGAWISPIFPKLESSSKETLDSSTHFKMDLIEYLSAYKAYQLKDWINHIAKHNMSSARVTIIGSVPGRHVGEKVMSSWGHMKLRKTLQGHGPMHDTVKSWPVIGQFSSIGSMGPNAESWLCGEWLQSLSTTKLGSGPQTKARLQLIFPSKDNVRLSLEGFPAGGSIPYSVNTAKKQTYLHDFFHVWKSDGRGRTHAMPHIKTYVRPMQDGSKAAWFLVTSANLSKAAWGSLEKKASQLMIRSYEIGVLFLPKFYSLGDHFTVADKLDTVSDPYMFQLPYDLPPSKYEKKDRPWMWDIPYMDLPDTNGNMWCPFSK